VLDLIVRSDTVVTPGGVGDYEVAIHQEKIVAVGARGTFRNDQAHAVIEATGKIVIPGGIDPHIHCKWGTPVGTVSAGSEVVSRAALYGGTTTIIDFAVWDEGLTLQDAIERREGDFRGQCHCDYAFHVTLHGAVPENVIAQIPETISAGYPTIKIYTTDVRPARKNWKLHFGDIWEVLQQLAGNGGLACIHSEDDDLVMHMYKKLFAQGRGHFSNMAEVHSALSEDLSFRRVIRLAENVEGAALYLMHVSAAAGVNAIEESRAKGFPIYGETLHQFALFTSEDYKRPNGQIYHTYPSLKTGADQVALWDAITRSGALSTMSTDGVCTPYSVKIAREQIDDTTGGNVGVEPRVSVVYTEMVTKRKCTLEHFVDVIAANAARIMGLYPRKGAITAGSDADITILDPRSSRKIQKENLHESDYTPWEGYETAVWPSTTILRGKRVVEDAVFLGTPGGGQNVPRKIASDILSGAALSRKT
jgi:dihydropyrimidinase